MKCGLFHSFICMCMLILGCGEICVPYRRLGIKYLKDPVLMHLIKLPGASVAWVLDRA